MGINTEAALVVRDALAQVHGSLGLPHLICLLTVAAKPGLSVNDLAEETGYPQQSVSRYAAVLLGRYENPTGLPFENPLLEQSINPSDPRRRAVRLTRAGTEFVEKLISNLSVRG